MKTLFLSILLLLHPVHVSLTGIEYDAANAVWSVFVKVWSDDLEADMKLGKSGGGEITGSPEECFFQYISDRLMIMEDGVPVKMRLLTAEVDGLEHRFTLTATGNKDIRSVTVLNRIMTRLYEDQANMMLISLSEHEEGYRFTVIDTIRSYKVK
ncbi:MAG: hypothetical protein GX622_05980 [Bacteroidales bacterium]|nr:hypothetical protein [Bacteroidales bacterium]